MHLPQQKKKKGRGEKKKKGAKEHFLSSFFDLLKAAHQSNKEQNMPVQGKKEEGRIRKRERKGRERKKEGKEKGEERKERNAQKYLMSFQKNTKKKPHWMRNNQTPNKQLLPPSSF